MSNPPPSINTCESPHFGVKGLIYWTLVVAIVFGFLHQYRLLLGVLFSSLAIGTLNNLISRRFWRATAFLLFFSIAWMGLQLFGPCRSLRNRVIWVVGVQRLQSWAVETLEKSRSIENLGLEQTLDPSCLPRDIRTLTTTPGFRFARILLHIDSSEEQDHVLFAFGGGFYHWGLRVGRPGFKPDPDRQFRMEELSSGVWFLCER